MKKSKGFIISSILTSGLLLASNAYSAPVHYQVDSQGMHASINFKIQHLGYSWIVGRFDSFKGEFTYDNADVKNSKVSIQIDTQSINTNHAERDKHLRSKDFLNVGKFPEARFVSTNITEQDGTLLVTGELTLNGTTKAINIESTKVGEGKDPWGGYRAGFSGTTQIKMADYGITYDLGSASANVIFELHLEGIQN